MSSHTPPVQRKAFKVKKGLEVTGDASLMADALVVGTLTVSSGFHSYGQSTAYELYAQTISAMNIESGN